MAETAIYRLAPMFVYDHWSRDFPEDQGAVSRKVSENKRSVAVELDTTGYDELLADARYYATEMVSAGFDDSYGRSMCRSAGAVVRTLEAQGSPAAGTDGGQ